MLIRKILVNDIEQLELFLGRFSTSCLFIRSNLKRAGLEFHQKEFQGEYLGAFDSCGAVTGVLVHYWNGMIMAQVASDRILQLLLNEFCSHVSRPVAGVIGEESHAKPILERLGFDDSCFANNKHEKLYVLNLENLNVPEDLEFSDYAMQSAADIDPDTLTHWLHAYEIEALGASEGAALNQRVQESVTRTRQGIDRWGLFVEGIPVSLCGFNARLPDCVQIGPVWTPPAFRNHRYARVLVALALKQARAQGVIKAVLFTDNPSAMKAYEAIGFEEEGYFRLALLKQPLAFKMPASV